MFSSKLYINSKKIYSYKKSQLQIDVYGNVYNKKELIKLNGYNAKFNLINFANNLAGSFFIYLKYKKNIYFLNDIFGNFRIYYVENKYSVSISDSFDFLRDNLEKKEKYKFNDNEIKYLLRHQYTSAGKTIINEINKMLPASFWTVNLKLEKKIYFQTSKKIADSLDSYENLNAKLIRKNIANTIIKNRPTFLMFSGGLDSTFLYYILRELNLAFNLIFVKYQPFDLDNYNDFLKVKAFEKKFNIKVQIIICNLELSHRFRRIAFNRHPLDISFFAIYYAFDYLKIVYGNCNIINGQSSDSIYCWGSSNKTVGSLLQRVMVSNFFYNSNLHFRKFYAGLLQFIYNLRRPDELKLIVPYELDKYYIGLLDPEGYLPVTSKNERYNKYLSSIVDDILKAIKEKKDLIMYFKLMYLQGASNIMLHQAAKQYSHNIVLPFLDARIVYLKLNFQSEFKNIIFPRYVLEKYLTKRHNMKFNLFDLLYIKKNKSFSKFNFLYGRYLDDWEKNLRSKYFR